ncbi:MAG: SAM-dependent methyltransferase [candidate division WOR-3 bacterium]
MERIKGKVISFKDFMKEALYGEKGFYTKKEFLTGERGDFVTPSNFSLPLILSLKKFIEEKGKELNTYEILEIGGGEGVFCENFLKIMKKIKYFFYEPSKNLLRVARERLKNLKEVIFLDSLKEIKNFKGFIIIIEVLDAFPFRRFVKMSGKIFEIMVDLENKKEILRRYDDNFLDYFMDKIPDNSVFEYSDDIIIFLKEIKDKIKDSFLIFLDYAESLNEIIKKGKGTARAFKKHSVSYNFYDEMGEKDITRTLNIDFLKKKFELSGYEIIEIKKLSDFLKDYLEEIFEYERILESKERLKLISQLNYLINPEAMGEIFKVFILRGSNP